MKLRKGAEILSAEKESIGKIDRVVVDPATKEITHLVSQKGFLFKKEKVISLEQVQTANEERVILNKGVDTDNLPDFEEVHHVLLEELEQSAPDQVKYAQPVFYYPLPGAVWWGMEPYSSYGVPPYVAQKERNIPEGEIPLRKDAEVVSHDGESIGRVVSLYTEPGGHKISHLGLVRGFLKKEVKIIPTFWVGGVYEEHIKLSVDEDFVDRLPSYNTDKE